MPPRNYGVAFCDATLKGCRVPFLPLCRLRRSLPVVLPRGGVLLIIPPVPARISPRLSSSLHFGSRKVHSLPALLLSSFMVFYYNVLFSIVSTSENVYFWKLTLFLYIKTGVHGIIWINVLLLRRRLVLLCNVPLLYAVACCL